RPRRAAGDRPAPRRRTAALGRFPGVAAGSALHRRALPLPFVTLGAATPARSGGRASGRGAAGVSKTSMRTPGELNGVLESPPAGAATAGAAPLTAPRKVSWRRRWARRLLVAALLPACLYLCRVPVLRAVGGFLVVDEP